MAQTIGEKILEALEREGELDDDQLAEQLGVVRQQINQRCRTLERQGSLVRGIGPHGKLVNRLKGTRPDEAQPSASPDPSSDGEEEPWFWEGNVQATLRSHLEAEGWHILQEADTASQQHGIDLLAERDGVRLVVEVKGWPKTTYQRGPKKGQPKPTQPTLQAKHWFSAALIGLIRLRPKHPDALLAVALPERPRYRTLIAESRWALERLGFGVFLVAEDGAVETLMRPSP